MSPRRGKVSAMRTILHSGALAACALAMQGCVFDDIRDELEQTNQRLTRVESQLGAIEKTNSELETLREQRLSSLDTLDGMNQTLASIDESLKSLDKHLAALRETISSIDNAIPFLSLRGGADDEEESVDGEVIEQGMQTGGESDTAEPEPAHEAPIDPEDEEPPTR